MTSLCMLCGNKKVKMDSPGMLGKAPFLYLCETCIHLADAFPGYLVFCIACNRITVMLPPVEKEVREKIVKQIHAGRFQLLDKIRIAAACTTCSQTLEQIFSLEEYEREREIPGSLIHETITARANTESVLRKSKLNGN
jgi:hypothetical protein